MGGLCLTLMKRFHSTSHLACKSFLWDGVAMEVTCPQMWDNNIDHFTNILNPAKAAQNQPGMAWHWCSTLANIGRHRFHRINSLRSIDSSQWSSISPFLHFSAPPRGLFRCRKQMKLPTNNFLRRYITILAEPAFIWQSGAGKLTTT